MRAIPRLRRVMAGVVRATAGLFVVGVVVDRRDDHHDERTEESATADHGEGSEAEHGGEETALGSSGESAEDRVLGIHTEAIPLVVVAVVVSIAFAVLLWRSDSEVVLGA